MASQSVPYLTPDDYLAIEEKAEFKSEYYNGEMFAMSRASWHHNKLTFRLVRLLDEQLDGTSCGGVGSDMRARVRHRSLYVSRLDYSLRRTADPGNTLINPTLIVEVLSPSTEGYDRGRKFDQYQNIESLAEYVIVAQDRVQVLLFTRQSDHRWLLSSATSLDDNIELASIGCKIPLGKLYEQIHFDDEPPLH